MSMVEGDLGRSIVISKRSQGAPFRFLTKSDFARESQNSGSGDRRDHFKRSFAMQAPCACLVFILSGDKNKGALAI
jgi:hypothetical protein